MDLLPVAVDLARLTIVPSGDDDARTVYAARMARGVGKASEAHPTPTPLPPSLTATILITSANSGVHSTHDTYVQQQLSNQRFWKNLAMPASAGFFFRFLLVDEEGLSVGRRTRFGMSPSPAAASSCAKWKSACSSRRAARASSLMASSLSLPALPAFSPSASPAAYDLESAVTGASSSQIRLWHLSQMKEYRSSRASCFDNFEEASSFSTAMALPRSSSLLLRTLLPLAGSISEVEGERGRLDGDRTVYELPGADDGWSSDVLRAVRNPSIVRCPVSITPIPENDNWTLVILKGVVPLVPTSSFHSLSPKEAITSTVTFLVKGKGVCFDLNVSYPGAGRSALRGQDRYCGYLPRHRHSQTQAHHGFMGGQGPCERTAS